ncbi:hypothetical protein C8R45DRAFT_1112680 [Mycena sanguinolenta]|nr:hypothetical protein C8R45DRAFT_1112680 [Mycena sanguinolenta]
MFVASYIFILGLSTDSRLPHIAAAHCRSSGSATAAAKSLCPDSPFPAIPTNAIQKEDHKDALIAFGTLTAEGLPNPDFTTWKTLGQGAATTVAAAFDIRLESKSGAYLVDSVEANDNIAPHCSDPETAMKLWTITEEIVGEKFIL